MSSINTNLSAITALQSLKATQTSMNKNQNQISTGLRVSEASHNASYWSISTKMKSDNSALGAVKDSIKQSKAMIDTYTSAIDKSLKYLDTMKTKLTAGSNPGADLAAIQVELKSSINGLKSSAASASFNGQNWLTGEGNNVKLVTSYDGEAKSVNMLTIDTSAVVLFDNAANPTSGLLKNVSNVDVNSPAKAQGFVDLDVTGLGANDTITFKRSDGVERSFTTTSSTLSAQVTAFNTAHSAADGVEASIVDGKLRLKSVDSGKDVAGSFFNVTAGTATAEAAGPPATAGYVDMTIDTTKLTAGDEIRFIHDDNGGTATLTPKSFKVGSEKSVDELVSSINSDSSLTSLVTASKVDGKLRLTAVNAAHAVTGGVADKVTGVQTTNKDIALADALKVVDKAINDLRAGSAMLGANKALLETQEEFIGVLSDSLTAGVSAFIDADMNEVSTRNQALQTQQQLGVQALSMANQNSQMILKLFQ